MRYFLFSIYFTYFNIKTAYSFSFDAYLSGLCMCYTYFFFIYVPNI